MLMVNLVCRALYLAFYQSISKYIPIFFSVWFSFRRLILHQPKHSLRTWNPFLANTTMILSSSVQLSGSKLELWTYINDPLFFFCWGFIQYIPHFPHPALGVLFTLFVPLVVALKYRQILVRWLTQYGRFFFFLFQNQRHQPLIPPDLYSAFFSKFRPKSDRGPWGSCIPCLK